MELFCLLMILLLSKRGLSANDALRYTVVLRGRTILLTTTTAICSLLPFLFNGSNEVFWSALAIGTLGGLVFCLFAIFVLLPALLSHKGKRQNDRIVN